MRSVPRAMAGVRSTIRNSANRLAGHLRNHVVPRDRDALSGLAGEVALRTFDQREILNQQNQIFEDSLQLSRSIRNPNFTKLGVMTWFAW